VKQYDKLHALGLLMRATGLHVGRPETTPAVTVNIQNNVADGSVRVWQRIDELVQRRQASLPLPTEQPIEIEALPTKDIEHA
jgi:hypothetical protein